MGQVNQESNLLNRVIALEREAAANRKLAGNTSSIISRGGLSLLNSSFLKMVDSTGVERLFIGGSTSIPLVGGAPQPVFIVRDALDNARFLIYDPFPGVDGYVPVVWIYDHLGHVVLTSDINGGMAEPWIPVPVYAKAWPSTFLDSLGTDLTVPVSACNGSAVWEGSIGKVSHPRIQYAGVFGRVTGVSGSPTYTLKVNGSTVDSFSQTAYAPAVRSSFNIASLIGATDVSVQLTLSATGTGTDRIAAQPIAVYMRQT